MPPRVSIRGIYATALTRFLEDDFEVVNPSPAIDRRFDRSFEVDAVDVAVSMTEDRQGLGLVGEPTAVDALVDPIGGLGIDTLTWRDPTPRGTVVEGTVIDTVGGGAVVDLGVREGYLPFEAAHGHVVEGDDLRVQVHTSLPPWADRRPTVDMQLRAFGGLVDLVRGSGSHRADLDDPQRAAELVRATEILPTDVPENWVVRWQPAAADADTDTLDAALALAVDRASAVEAQMAGRDAMPESTTWVWFGRASRFELDSIRADVMATMPGHHRIKATTDPAGAAVDFAERLCSPSPDGGFPFDVVVDQFGPDTGDEITISHGKPDGRRFPLGRAIVADRDHETLTVRREMRAGGEYDALEIPREDGDVATTTLKEGRWWYPTVYRADDGTVRGTYVNICTPVELFPTAATYVDLEVDVVRHADGTVERVDDAELDAAVADGHIAPRLAEKAREVATAVERALQ